MGVTVEEINVSGEGNDARTQDEKEMGKRSKRPKDSQEGKEPVAANENEGKESKAHRTGGIGETQGEHGGVLFVVVVVLLVVVLTTNTIFFGECNSSGRGTSGRRCCKVRGDSSLTLVVGGRMIGGRRDSTGSSSSSSASDIVPNGIFSKRCCMTCRILHSGVGDEFC